MDKITHQRIGELIRAVLELLWNKPGGLDAGEVIAILPQIVNLTDYEREYAPLSNMPRYERYVRLATIPLVKAGWLVKNNKGRWRLTEEGKEMCLHYHSVTDFYDAAVKQLEDVRLTDPGILAETEKAEEKAWEQIRDFIRGLNRWEFNLLVADLFESMGYYILWSAPSDKDHGYIDLVVNSAPLDARSSRMFVHVRHNDKPANLKNVQSFSSAIQPSNHGVIISTRGFEHELQKTINEDPQSKITLIDLETFFDLWVKHISEHRPEAIARFPLKIVYFLAGNFR